MASEETLMTDGTGPDLGELRDRLAAAGVEYLFAAYVDIHGVPKAKCVPIAHFEGWAAGSELYTVGALEGMGDLGPNEDECSGVPDLGSLIQLPWEPRYAVAAADLFFHGEPYTHDCRRVLRRQVEEAAALGYRVDVGVETEVYVLRNTDQGWRPLVSEDEDNAPTRGYDLESTILADRFLHPMVGYMNRLGWDVFSFDHEGGDGQYEFDFAYTDALTMADRLLWFRLLAKHVARGLGGIASFMPKPWSSAFGSGAHINLSLADAAAGENRFADPGGDENRVRYTDLARHFTAGVLRHGDALSAVLCPTVNSYKRLLPRGLMQEISWAPVYRAYGNNNRTLMCRLPANRACLEVRTADSACNLYLGLAFVIAAGLEGVAARLDPGLPVDVDTYKADPEELERLGAHRLPQTLGAALDAFEEDDLATAVFGKQFHADYARYKRAEWDEFNTVVGEWEVDKYLRQL
jgi:glutamine synthetase